LESLPVEDDSIFNGPLVYFRPFDIIYGHLVYFVVIWYIFHVLIYCTKENLATLNSKEKFKASLKYLLGRFLSIVLLSSLPM
jgi:hypothetical protein